MWWTALWFIVKDINPKCTDKLVTCLVAMVTYLHEMPCNLCVDSWIFRFRFTHRVLPFILAAVWGTHVKRPPVETFNVFVLDGLARISRMFRSTVRAVFTRRTHPAEISNWQWSGVNTERPPEDVPLFLGQLLIRGISVQTVGNILVAIVTDANLLCWLCIKPTLCYFYLSNSLDSP